MCRRNVPMLLYLASCLTVPLKCTGPVVTEGATTAETQTATEPEATTTQATTPESILENSIEDPESGVVLVNVSHIYSGYDCAPYFSYSAASYTYLVVTACSGTYSEASQSCASLGGSMGELRDENVAAAMTFAAYTEQGAKVHSKPASKRRRIAEYKFWTAPAIALPWDYLAGSANDSIGMLKVTVYDGDFASKYEWKTTVYGDDTSQYYFWLCEVGSSGNTTTTTTTTTAATTSTITTTATTATTTTAMATATEDAIKSGTIQEVTAGTSPADTSEGTTEEVGHGLQTYTRKRRGSVMDYRPSAVCIGTLGIIVIVSVVTTIVAMDVDRLYRAYQNAAVKTKVRRLRREKSALTSGRDSIISEGSIMTSGSIDFDFDVTSLDLSVTSPVPPLATSLE